MENKATDPKFLEKVRKRFEDLSYWTGREYKLNNEKEFPLDKWTLRDYISEAHYEMEMRADDIYDNNDRAEYNRYKRFVNAYKNLLTDDIKCYQNHGDTEYDLVSTKISIEEATIKALQGKLIENKITEVYNDNNTLFKKITFIKKLLNKSINSDNYTNMKKTQLKVILKKYCDELLSTGFRGYVIYITYKLNNDDLYSGLYIKTISELTDLYGAKIFSTFNEAQNFLDKFNPKEDITILNTDIIDLTKMIKKW